VSQTDVQSGGGASDVHLFIQGSVSLPVRCSDSLLISVQFVLFRSFDCVHEPNNADLNLLAGFSDAGTDGGCAGMSDVEAMDSSAVSEEEVEDQQEAAREDETSVNRSSSKISGNDRSVICILTH